MSDRRENRLSRNLKVRTFFADHLSQLIVNVPTLANLVIQYNAKTEECINHRMDATEDITGASEQKAYLRKIMQDIALEISGALRTYFIGINDISKAKKADLKKSELDKAREDEVYITCKLILEDAQANSLALVPIGIPVSKIADLEAAMNAYFAYIRIPREEIKERTSAIKMFDEAMKESDVILSIIKSVMQTQKSNHPQLYMQFIGSTRIDDLGGRGASSVPEFKFTLEPGVYYTALTIPYATKRRFKAVNLSDNWVILWGLSDKTGEFTYPAVSLNNNSTNILSSANLGGSGNNLIFFNPTNEPIPIELTVLNK
jgi:hypothetical protein